MTTDPEETQEFDPFEEENEPEWPEGAPLVHTVARREAKDGKP